MTEEQISLKSYIELQIKSIERELSRLSADHIDKHRYDQLRLQVGGMAEGMQELEKRLEILEDHDRVGMWAFRVLVGVCTALAIGWLSGLFS